MRSAALTGFERAGERRTTVHLDPVTLALIAAISARVTGSRCAAVRRSPARSKPVSAALLMRRAPAPPRQTRRRGARSP